MKSHLTKFLKDLDKEVTAAKKSLDDRIKGTGEAIQKSLMGPRSSQGTPVQTGWLKSNWIVSLDEEYLDVAGSKENIDKSIQNSAWGSFLNETELYLRDNLYFNNNVYYGPWVDQGTTDCRIEPQHFRHAAVQSGKEYLKANRKNKR